MGGMAHSEGVAMHRRWGALATVAALVAAFVGVTGHEAAANPYARCPR